MARFQHGSWSALDTDWGSPMAQKLAYRSISANNFLGFTILFSRWVWTLSREGLPAGIAVEDNKSSAGDISCVEDTTTNGDGAREPHTDDPQKSSSRQALGEGTPAAGNTTHATDLGWCTRSKITAATGSKADSYAGWIGSASIGEPGFSLLIRSTMESWCGANQ
jgi:hypothetical protein